MSPDDGARPGTAVPPPGPEELFRAPLQLIAQGVREILGFQFASISVVRTPPDGPQELEVIADAGDDDSSEEIIGRRTPLAALLAEIEDAEVWGQFRFLPHELTDQTREDEYGWIVPEMEVIDAPDAWHPLDLLVALLHDDQGVLRGTLVIDVPDNGRRPGPEHRRLLEKFAVQAARTVVTTLEREELAEQVRLAEAARTIVRNANAQEGLSRILSDCQQGLVEGFRSQGSWIQTFDEDGTGTGALHSSAGVEIRQLPDELVELAERAARWAWAEQTALVINGDRHGADLITEDDHRRILGFLDSIGVASLLFVPLGAGSECLGNLVLTRRLGDPDWSELDRTAALDIGHDLGRVVINARTFEREHQLVVELRALDTYKGQLIATVSHELKNPLAAISGYLEMLEPAPELSSRSRGAVDAMTRGTARLGRVVDDLLLLSKVGDPSHAIIPAPVDLVPLVAEVVDLIEVQARAKDIEITTDVPADPVVAHGDAWELDRVVTNLLSNAVKYTGRGRRVGLRVWEDGAGVHVAINDEGLGISEADQEHLFDEFFRSTNPEAVREPGTGLGLAIVKRIVDRHDGSIALDSELGHGSVFTVTLPPSSTR